MGVQLRRCAGKWLRQSLSSGETVHSRLALPHPPRTEESAPPPQPCPDSALRAAGARLEVSLGTWGQGHVPPAWTHRETLLWSLYFSYHWGFRTGLGFHGRFSTPVARAMEGSLVCSVLPPERRGSCRPEVGLDGSSGVWSGSLQSVLPIGAMGTMAAPATWVGSDDDLEDRKICYFCGAHYL